MCEASLLSWKSDKIFFLKESKKDKKRLFKTMQILYMPKNNSGLNEHKT